VSRVLLVERNTFIRESLRQILQARFPSLIIREVICNGDCLSAMGEFRPDVLILGIADNDEEALQSIEQIREQFPSTVIVLFTDYEVEEYRKEAILRGANHIISKELWTGGEILALMKTILSTKDSWDRRYAEEILVDKETLQQPIERRQKDSRGLAREKEYLTENPDRRRE